MVHRFKCVKCIITHGRLILLSQLHSAFVCEAVVHPSRLPWSWLGTAGHDIGGYGRQVLQIQALVWRGGTCFNRWTKLHQAQRCACLAVYPCCLSCVVTQSWVPPRHVFLLQCSKNSNCKSYCMSLRLYQRLDMLVRLYLADSCSRQSLSHEVLQLYCCNSWRKTLPILYLHQSKIRLSLCRTIFLLDSIASVVVGSLHICPWTFQLEA